MSTIDIKTKDIRPQPAIGTYFSPPESSKMDSFPATNQNAATHSTFSHSSVDGQRRLPSFRALFPPLSPPVSPQTKLDKEVETSHALADAAHARDPPLFPADDQAHSGQPLFGTIQKKKDSRVEEVIDAHISKRSPSDVDALPRPEDYMLIAGFVSKTFQLYSANPRGYYRDRMEELKIYPSRFPQKSSQIAKGRAAQFKTPVKRSYKVIKPSVEKLPSIKRRQRASPRERAIPTFDNDVTGGNIDTKIARITPHRDDTDFMALPDYSPSSATIGESGKALKTEWRGHPLDLSTDPDRHHLHPAELGLASTLRLSCAQYLCSKRRIFASRLECLRIGKEFRKTTAQQACKIDVNKASKLWTAFDKVGWFDPVHMRQYA